MTNLENMVLENLRKQGVVDEKVFGDECQTPTTTQPEVAELRARYESACRRAMEAQQELEDLRATYADAMAELGRMLATDKND